MTARTILGLLTLLTVYSCKKSNNTPPAAGYDGRFTFKTTGAAPYRVTIGLAAAGSNHYTLETDTMVKNGSFNHSFTIPKGQQVSLDETAASGAKIGFAAFMDSTKVGEQTFSNPNGPSELDWLFVPKF